AVIGVWEDGIDNAGEAYVFYRDQGGVDNWGQVTELIPQNGQKSHGFGMRVAISGDRVIVDGMARIFVPGSPVHIDDGSAPAQPPAAAAAPAAK
ncbi:MAG: hypothetical protein GY848_01395, partial [Methyloversatilis sp.]|nr:hypothetical protein [Methyloversatilis sp.]